MSTNRFKPWLWPDHPISKAESRQLRQEQNALLKSHDELLEALEKVLWHTPHKTWDSELMHGLLVSIERISRAAIAKAKGQ